MLNIRKITIGEHSAASNRTSGISYLDNTALMWPSGVTTENSALGIEESVKANQAGKEI